MLPVRTLDPAILAESFAELRGLILPALAPYGGKLYLFGSHARGEANWASDIDLAVEAEAPIPDSVIGDLREAIEESTVPYHVDLIDLGRVSPEFAARVRAEAIAWTG